MGEKCSAWLLELNLDKAAEAAVEYSALFRLLGCPSITREFSTSG
jgi:hypothetical protein